MQTETGGSARIKAAVYEFQNERGRNQVGQVTTRKIHIFGEDAEVQTK